MSIRNRLEDARFLLTDDRVDGALLSVCAAIGATSRKRYPDHRQFGDKRAFTKFLGEEMVVVTAGAIGGLTIPCPGMTQRLYPDGAMPLEDILYEFVRCTLAHEGRVGDNIEFAEENSISLRWESDRLIVGRQLLTRLLLVPEYAPENASEFPHIAAMTDDEVGNDLFGSRAIHRQDYLAARRQRIGVNSQQHAQ